MEQGASASAPQGGRLLLKLPATPRYSSARQAAGASEAPLPVIVQMLVSCRRGQGGRQGGQAVSARL